MGFVIALVILIELASLFQSLALPRSSVQLSAVLPAVVIALTDQERTTNQLGGLTANSLLTQAAQEAANDMATRGYFAHVSPDGKNPWYWLGQVGYQYQYAGENLAVNFDDSQQLVNAWMDSPTHRANLLGANYTETGVGMASGVYQGQQVVFVVQFYTSPLDTGAAQPATQKKSSTATHSVPAVTTSLPITPTVAAAETQATVIPATPQKAQSNNGPHLSLWTQITSSPHTYATGALFLIAVFFGALLVLGYTPLSRHILHPQAAINGLALMAVVIGILILNKSILFRNVMLPTDTQNAAAVQHAIQ
ncbi:MAG: CAP domain-containing protein [bacterium]